MTKTQALQGKNTSSRRVGSQMNEGTTLRRSTGDMVWQGFQQPGKQVCIQPKLELSQPGDIYEREADQTADRIMRQTTSGNEEDEMVQPSSIGESISRYVSGNGLSLTIISPGMENSIRNSKGNGTLLPSAFRSRMETGFGVDFSPVKIHTGPDAVQMNRELNANAFTHEHDIFFNSGQYNTENITGQRLLAHELTHVVQQTGMVQKEDNNSTIMENYYNIIGPIIPFLHSPRHKNKLEDWLIRKLLMEPLCRPDIKNCSSVKIREDNVENGCGSELSTYIVPDGIYKEACDEHDRCYSTEGRSQEECDYMLYENANKAWEQADFLGRSSVLHLRPHEYFSAVYFLGKSPYEDAQRNPAYKLECNGAKKDEADKDNKTKFVTQILQRLGINDQALRNLFMKPWNMTLR